MTGNQNNESEKFNNEKVVEVFQEEFGCNGKIFQLLDSFPYMVAIFSTDGTAVFVNRKFCENYNLANPNEFVKHYNILKDTYILDTLEMRDFVLRVFNGETLTAKNFKTPFEREKVNGHYGYTVKKEVIREFKTNNITGFTIFDEEKQDTYVVITSQITNTYEGKKEIIEAQEYINKNWQQKFSLSDVANAVGFSMCYLSRLFKENTGKTPYEYYKNIKIDKLKEELKNQNTTVAKAFAECGLVYKGKYEKYFKEMVGMTPSQYKRTQRRSKLIIGQTR